MPANDQRFVQRLDDFTKALEGIVELLKEDIGKKNVDNVNKLLTNMNDDLKSVVKNMEIVMKTTQKIETQNDKILKEVQEARKAKETGMFGNVADVDNKRKILDAVKVIVLIAAGVLAIGMAFKIIAPVNFLSVIAIGLAIVFIAGAFVIVSAVTENMKRGDAEKTIGIMVLMSLGIAVSSWILSAAATLTVGKALSILFTATALGGSLIVMAMAVEKSKLKPADMAKMALLPLVLPFIAIGITVSSFILSKVAPMSFGQILTTIFVAGAIGVMLYLIGGALDKTKMENKKVGQFLLLPIIIPAMAMGIVAASWIFKGIVPLSFMQMVSAIFTAVTVGILVFLMTPIIDGLKGIKKDDVLKTGGLIIVLAASLVGASYILSLIKLMTFKDALLLVVNSIAIGLSVLALVPTILLLQSIKEAQMTQAAKNIILISGAIAVSSWILSLGFYDNIPDLGWSIGAGASIIAFAGTIWAIHAMKLTEKQILFGGLAILGISAVVMLTSWVLGIGNYEKYPTLGWALGVGLSLASFGLTMIVLGAILSSGPLGAAVAGAMALGALAILGVSAVIVAVSWLLAVGNYAKYPGLDWALGVGFSLVTFGAFMVAVGLAIVGIALGAASMFIIASTIVGISNIISRGNWANGPSEEWAKSVSMLIESFASVMVDTALIPNLLLRRSAEGLFIIARSIVEVSEILSKGKYDEGPSEEWAKGTINTLTRFVKLGGILAFFPTLLIAGIVSLLALSGSIAAVSLILAKGDYTGGPDEEWAKATSKVMESTAITALLFGLIPAPFFSLMLFNVLQLAGAIAAASIILSQGIYTGGPTEQWASGVALSIKAFAEGISALQETNTLIGNLFGSEAYNSKIKNIAKAMKVAAIELSDFDWGNVNNYPSTAWSMGVGTAIKMFAEGIAALQESDKGWFDESFETKIKHLSQAIKVAADILSEYDWGKLGANDYPSEAWSTGVGKAINAFAIPLSELGKADISGRDITRSIRRISRALVDAAEIFSEYDWSKTSGYPDDKWINGVGNAMGTFVRYLIEIEKNDIGRGDVRVMNRIIDSMIMIAWKLRMFTGEKTWTISPQMSNWVDVVGTAIRTFVEFLVSIESNNIGKYDIRMLGRTIDVMIDAADKFSGVDVWASPPAGWAENIEISITAINNAIQMLQGIENFDLLEDAADSMVNFAKKIEKILRNEELYAKGGAFDSFTDSIRRLTESFPTSNTIADGLNALGDAFIKISSMGMTTGDSIRNLTRSIVELSDSLKNVDMESIDKLSKFSNGILVLSLLDEKKFNDALAVIDKKKNDIVAILSESAGVKSKSPIGGEITLEESMASESETSDRMRFYEEILTTVKSLDSNVGEMLQIQKTPVVASLEDNDETSSPVAGAGAQQTNPNSKNSTNGQT